MFIAINNIVPEGCKAYKTNGVIGKKKPLLFFNNDR